MQNKSITKKYEELKKSTSNEQVRNRKIVAESQFCFCYVGGTKAKIAESRGKTNLG